MQARILLLCTNNMQAFCKYKEYVFVMTSVYVQLERKLACTSTYYIGVYFVVNSRVLAVIIDPGVQ